MQLGCDGSTALGVVSEAGPEGQILHGLIVNVAFETSIVLQLAVALQIKWRINRIHQGKADAKFLDRIVDLHAAVITGNRRQKIAVRKGNLGVVDGEKRFVTEVAEEFTAGNGNTIASIIGDIGVKNGGFLSRVRDIEQADDAGNRFESGREQQLGRVDVEPVGGITRLGSRVLPGTFNVSAHRKIVVQLDFGWCCDSESKEGSCPACQSG